MVLLWIVIGVLIDMPVYAYKCDACGHEFDKFQHFVDDPLTVCPVCSEEALRKVYSPVGIVFKGKGFYATDNRSPSGISSSKPSNNSSANGSSDTSSSDTAKASDSTGSDKKSSTVSA